MSDQSPEGVCNLALAALGADPIQSIDAPTKPNEKLLAIRYPQTVAAELRRHRWLCCLRVDRLTPIGDPIINDIDGTLYRYAMPNDAVRAVRVPGCTWTVRGRELLDIQGVKLDAKFVVNRPPAYWDTLLVEAVVAKLAAEICEKVTQSTDKKADLKDDYKRAIDEAKRSNALELGPEDVVGVDENYSWLMARQA